MSFTLVSDPDKAYFEGDHVESDIEVCKAKGLELAQWLTQDGTEAVPYCIPVRLDEEI